MGYGVSLLCVLIFICIGCSTVTGAKVKNGKHREIDLIRTFKDPSKLGGVEKLKPKGLKFTSQWNPRKLPNFNFKKFFRKFRGDLSFYFSGQMIPQTKLIPIFTIYHRRKTLPYFEMQVNLKESRVVLRYQGRTSFQRSYLRFEDPVNILSELMLHLNQSHVTIKLNCMKSRTVKLKQPLAKFSNVAKISLQDYRSKRKFIGLLFSADVYAYQKDGLSTCSEQVAPLQKDQRDSPSSTADDRVKALQDQLTQLNSVVNSLQAENSDLKARLSELDTCVCDPQCLVNGVIYNDGETWQQDTCTMCTCQKGKPECTRRTELQQCMAPCANSPCQNQGYCVDMGPDPQGYQCMCQPPYDGALCEIRQNPCVWPVEPGFCNLTVLRYYYDRFDEQCKPFNYTGCGGNVNNYETIQACQEVAMSGACCFRRFKANVNALVSNDQMEESKCQVMSLGDCKVVHQQNTSGYLTEVIGFYPSLTCKEAGCGALSGGCVYEGKTYQPGEEIYQACQKCKCEIDEQWSCNCTAPSRRKEIRDMTNEEIARFRIAVQQLRLTGPGNEWEKMRDMYMAHSMHSNGGPYYLPWHRVFLRNVEKKLQEIDCQITLPYFDFTTDVGNFAEAVIWQPNYFGGNGYGIFRCVRDHNFGPADGWQPCIMRDFNTNIQLPSLAELALALSSDDYTEMSTCLETYISYVHRFIGGDMATTGSPYDPVFFAVHAYVDMLYWTWQQRGNNKFKYPAAFGNIPMIPFNIPARSALDLENELCVVYVSPSKGHPCNRTSVVTEPDVNRGDIPAADRVDFRSVPGYDVDGYDRNGYDVQGYKRDGYNRDGYNRTGYDRDGYNRYGYDSSGFNRYGLNRTGFDIVGKKDPLGVYDRFGYDDFCLNLKGLTKEGLDMFGFDVQGYDVYKCNYLFNGPFATLHSLTIFEILSIQDKGFLMSVPRVCPRLGAVPQSWTHQFWIPRMKDVTGMVPVVHSETTTLSLSSSRFCFDTTSYLSPCSCQTITSCVENPCLKAECSSYPEATCQVDFCTSCKAIWYHNNRIVDCQGERDFCQPNPCLNGGTCVKSVWPTESQYVTCQCPPGFDGHLCQHTAVEVCSLPLNTGTCDKQMRRWYFNYKTQKCEEFVYTGCGGNANHFNTDEECQSRCELGACCYRLPQFKNRVVGYDLQGYDRYGFNIDGFNRKGERRTVNNSTPLGSDVYNSQGFDWQGYDKHGFDKDGYNRMGYDVDGYDREGFNVLGYSKIGEYDGIIEYNEEGYTVEGYNRAGLNCYGYNRRGLNVHGVSSAYKYQCRPHTLAQCQKLDEKEGYDVLKFVPGERCSDVNCVGKCGCSHGNTTYKLYEQFQIGCQACVCTGRGVIECNCPRAFTRKEIRDLTKDELLVYQRAIKRMAVETGYPSKWFQFAEMYSKHIPQAVGSPAFLPWNRYFLKYLEQELQCEDCEMTIPYYDWTIDAGEPHKSVVWSSVVFGGNGDGQTGCVPFHMFKDYYPPNWTPCLRRQFNNSVSLPDAINVQLAINEPSYDKFRLQVEVMLNVFKSFVNGHMNSDLSPYDPAFLSVLAFIDKIWDEWLHKSSDRMLEYPQKLRYVPMEPFKVTPDDVMDSGSQVCIEYIPISKRAICNITLPIFGYDVDGYDRHGLDREGYDMAGFDVNGIGRNGSRDTRGIYNIYGYDRHGYNRQGYDMTGFDRFGFYINMYNVDGFDGNGYDKWGYDRYGFDRNGVTPFGFDRNNTFVLSSYPDIFDKFGYNRFGYNTYGFDRKGYDIFGFDSTGLDKDRCNNYFLGPMYMIIKSWSERHLKDLDLEIIRIIARICPPVSSLPDWMYTVNWMNRGGQIPLIETIHTQSSLDHRYDPNYVPRVSSVTTDKIWLPVSPDRRLCFATHYYSQCPFGKFPVTCRNDLCQGRTCPGIRDALCRTNNCGSCQVEWYNGVTGVPVICAGCIHDGVEHPEGSTWRKSECEVCQCQQGLASCSLTICPPVGCQYPVKVPGQCCPSCDGGCQYEGRIYEPGATLIPISAPCDQCVCRDGNLDCRRQPCPDLGRCKSSVTLPGDCCPTCMDCGDYANATKWNRDPCTKCACINGDVKCTKVTCPPAECANPLTPRGECCPICRDCYYKGRNIPDGKEFLADPCLKCVCKHGDVDCREKDDCPPARCSNPVYPPGQCCPVCDSDCDYDMRTYKHQQTFIASYDPCLNCTCTNSIVRCIPIYCPSVTDLPCRNPVRRGGNCCDFICPICKANGKEYNFGDVWTSENDKCEICECKEGIVSCRRKQICIVQCTHGIIPKGDCCSPCRDCLFNGRVIKNGQRFPVPGDTCQQCTCQDGNVRCQTAAACPVLPCTVTELLPGDCCPRCKGCEYNGRIYENGEMVIADVCSRCECREGQVSCSRLDCDRPACENPVVVEGRCCPVCQGCQYGGKTFREGQRFTPSQKPCESCVCQDGRVRCERKQDLCPAVKCTHPETQPGQCCPICDGCMYRRRRFRNGVKFVPPGGDYCKVGRCMNGNISIMTMDCPKLNCPNPVKPKGQCCGVCPTACTVQGQDYMEGQTFADPRDKCNVCTCSDGQISCKPMTCGRTDCSNPTVRPGDCCPTCLMCTYNNRVYLNGETIPRSNDPCEKCTCVDGNMRCKAIICPRVNCVDPIIKPEECCVTCPDGCFISGVRYREGDRVPHPTDNCQECLCRGSKLDCRKKRCPDPRCRHPSYLPGSCCPECTDCTYLGLIFENGQTFNHPTEKCQQCTCSYGDVRCLKQTCPDVSCQYPTTVNCCPACVGCFYENKERWNGETFPTRRDACKTCICGNGGVNCTVNPCPRTNCQHPVQGRCCKECNDCFYQNRQFRNGQKFVDFEKDCSECTCRDGTVRCAPLPCPTVACSNPSKGRCCPECRNCLVNGKEIMNNQPVPNSADPCQECICRNGNVECRPKPCPRVQCHNPVQRQCCMECSDCFYQGREYKNNTAVFDSLDTCSQCMCLNGNVDCRRQACPLTQCNCPVVVGCCPVCGDCLYREQVYGNGMQFPDPTDPCKECVCKDGSVTCYRKQCQSVTCSNPVMTTCCPECNDCVYRGRVLGNGQSVMGDRCQTCTCQYGSVQCASKQCSPVNCANPYTDYTDYCGCLSCERCMFQQDVYENGATFPHKADQCQTCQCLDGTVQCTSKQCSRVNCDDPYTDPCGCPSCDRCMFQQEVYENGATFPLKSDRCQTCQCSNGNVRCQAKYCAVNCDSPARTDGCCPICTDCMFEGGLIRDGLSSKSRRNPCQNCTCQRGSVTCQQQQCPPLRCSRPIEAAGECCPVCPVCNFLGKVYDEGKTFRHPEDECKVCICEGGRVTCLRQECDVSCSHPTQGTCCPSCDNCLFEGQEYNNRAVFNPDPCRTCNCQDGNVRCNRQSCPPLTCLQQETVPGQCCPQCRSCRLNGKEYVHGSEFVLEDDPCVTCACGAGVMTCMEMQCFATCDSPVTFPGQCCPICVGCRYNGRMYASGETFSPSGDPCDECSCFEGSLRCRRQTCPQVANCPADQQVAPSPGECCPSCAGVPQNCTAGDAGSIIKPKPSDPCFSCECKPSGIWMCSRDSCPTLSCPPAVQTLPAGQCCPECPACHDVETDRYFDNGDVWTDPINPCLSCQCQQYRITCESQSCPSVACGTNQRAERPAGQCCDVCVDIPVIDCQYQGVMYKHASNWQVDDCTECQCLGGEVKCMSQRCPALDCGPQAVPTILPATCCPVCMSRPASCIVFGDPHYYTFDGTTVHFQGLCKYIMAADCENNDFVVEVHHDRRGEIGEVSWAQNFTVTLGGTRISLLRNQVVKVNGRAVYLPYYYDPRFSVERTKENLLLNTKLGLKLLWNGESYAELTVPGEYKGKTCGLCGNFNGIPQDDLRTKAGTITNSPSEFGNNWKADGEEDCDDAVDFDPCTRAGYRARKFASTQCSVLSSSKFSRCHRAIAPDPFFASCVYDMCVCGDNSSCLCDILSAYAKECAKAGVRLEWREPGLCDYNCDTSKGFVFDECGPVCPRTCDNFDTPLGNVTANCFKPCIASCQCPADQVLLNGACTPFDKCPSVQRGDITVKG